MKCRQYFNTFFLQIINNYINFFHVEKGENGLELPGLDLFNTNEYLKLFSKDDLPFMEAFCTQTMMFSRFLEESYQVLYNCDVKNIVSFQDHPDEISQFIYQIKQVNISSNPNYTIKDHGNLKNFISNSVLKIIEPAQNLLIREAIYRYKFPAKIDLMGYLVKYYYKFYQNQDQDLKKHRRQSSFSKYPLDMLSSVDLNNINKGFQLLPNFVKEKIVNLNKMFAQKEIKNPTSMDSSILISTKKTDANASKSETKLSIFSSPKPLHSPTNQCSLNDINKYISQKELDSNIPYEEPTINSPSNLKKQNYFLYYQIIKRNTIGEPSPPQKKRIFDDKNTKRFYNTKNTQDVNMIRASIIWDKYANHCNDDNQNENLKYQDDKIKTIDDAPFQQDQKELKDIQFESFKPNRHAIWNPSKDLSHINDSILNTENCLNKQIIGDPIGTAPYIRNKKQNKGDFKKEWKESNKNKPFKMQAGVDIQEKDEENDLENYKNYRDGEFYDEKITNIKLNGNIKMFKEINDNHQDISSKKIIFEKLKSPIKNINIIDSPIRNNLQNSINRYRNGSTGKRVTKSCCVNKTDLTISHFKGDEDENPQTTMPEDVKREKYTEISGSEKKISVFGENSSQINKWSFNNNMVTNIKKESYTEDMLLFVKNLDTVCNINIIKSVYIVNRVN